MDSETPSSDPVLPDARVNVVPVKEPVIGRVASNDLCMKGKSNSFVRHTAIDISGTPLAGHFLSGQSFGVIPPGVDEEGKPHKVRLYSIACPTWGEDGKGQVLSTTPKRVIEEYKPQRPGDDPKRHDLFLGVCSNYLCNLQPGDEVKVSGPNGKRFVLPVDPEAHDYLFIATGTGIAPFRGFALELLQRPGGGSTRSKIHLMMGTPYTTDLLYDDLFRRLAKEHPNFKYWTAVSREARPGGGRGIYVDQILNENIDELRDFLASSRTVIYVCGLLGMQFGIYRALANAGLTAGYITLGDELKGIEPAKWTEEQMRMKIKATRRCMLEVY